MKERIYSLSNTLGQHLLQRSMKVTAAESCTGGGIAAAITNVAGSSAWFDLGVVTYSNQMKTAQLSVPDALLQEHGAVSEAVVRAMLSGVLELSGADIGVAVSGIAGPGGGSAEKPVGTVYIAWGSSSLAKAEAFYFSGDRAAVNKLCTRVPAGGDLCC